MPVFGRSNGAWTQGDLRARSDGAWTDERDAVFGRLDGAWVQCQPDPAGDLLAPANLAAEPTSNEATFTWDDPTMDAVPTDVQYRIPEITPVWTEIAFGITEVVWAALSPDTNYQFQARYIVRTDGEITATGPTATVFFTTLELAGPGTPAADPMGTGNDSIVNWGFPNGTPGPVGGTDCWWEYVIQQFTFELGFTDTLVTAEVDGDIEALEFNFVDEGFACGDTLRWKYREVCDSVPQEWQYASVFSVICDYSDTCGGVAQTTAFAAEPYLDAVLAMPKICYEDARTKIEDFIAGDAEYGRLPGLVAPLYIDGAWELVSRSDNSDGGSPVVAGRVAGLVPLGSAVPALQADMSISMFVYADEAPSIGPFPSTRILTIGETVQLRLFAEGAGVSASVVVPMLDGGAFSLSSTTELALGVWHHIAVTIDQDGDKLLYVDGVLDVTDADTEYADFSDLTGAVELYGNPNMKHKSVAVWGRVLDASEIGGIYAPGVLEEAYEVYLDAPVSYKNTWVSFGLDIDNSMPLDTGAEVIRASATDVSGMYYAVAKGRRFDQVGFNVQQNAPSIGGTVDLAVLDVYADFDEPLELLGSASGTATTAITVPVGATTADAQRHVIVINTSANRTMAVPSGYRALAGFTSTNQLHVAIRERGATPDEGDTIAALNLTASSSCNWQSYSYVLNGVTMPVGAHARQVTGAGTNYFALANIPVQPGDLIFQFNGDSQSNTNGQCEGRNVAGTHFWQASPVFLAQPLDRAQRGPVSNFILSGFGTTEHAPRVILRGVESSQPVLIDETLMTNNSDILEFPAVANPFDGPAMLIQCAPYSDEHQVKITATGWTTEQLEGFHLTDSARDINGGGEYFMIWTELVDVGGSTTPFEIDNTERTETFTTPTVRTFALPVGDPTVSKAMLRCNDQNGRLNSTTIGTVNLGAVGSLPTTQCVIVTVLANNDPAQTLTLPAGWTLLWEDVTAHSRVTVAWQVSTGSLGSEDWIYSGACKAMICQRLINGMDTSDPFGTVIDSTFTGAGATRTVGIEDAGATLPAILSPYLIFHGGRGGGIGIGQQNAMTPANFGPDFGGTLTDDAKAGFTIMYAADYQDTQIAISRPGSMTSYTSAWGVIPLNADAAVVP
jgi:hypothetical protein